MFIRHDYDMYVDRVEELEEGKELILEIRECREYRVERVKALLSKDPQGLPGGKKLLLRDHVGRPIGDPWGIKILERL